MKITKSIIIISCLITCICGCKQKEQSPSAAPVALQDTIGSICEPTGFASVQVQGYSLVWGLPGTGSGQCSPAVKEQLRQLIHKYGEDSGLVNRYPEMTADQIIESLTTAVVMVRGLVPAGAPKGKKFEVQVTAFPNSQITSLQGGILMKTELQVVAPGRTGQPLASRPTAYAEGPIFINPFTKDNQKSDPRYGVVLNGGETIFDRNIQLAILQPDYRTAQLIQRRINTRFGSMKNSKIAEAKRNSVSLQIPDEYRDEYQRFVSLVLGLYLQDNPGYLENKIRELNEAAQKPDADYEAISLAWEGLGRVCLPSLEKIYQSSTGKLQYYAARTALYLENMKAIDTLIQIAMDDSHPCQLPATRDLKRNAGDPSARACLEKLLNSSNVRLRLLAYDGLSKIKDPCITSVAVPSGYRIDFLETTGTNLACVWTADQPRIVFFGRNARCHDNVFFEWKDLITINSRPNEDTIKIIRQLGPGQKFVTLSSSNQVEDLIQTLAMPLVKPGVKKRSGAGLSFSQLAGVLYRLCEDNQVIPAEFRLHRVPEDLIG